jgi:hypothetical protein
MTYIPIYRARRPRRMPLVGATVAALGMLVLAGVCWPDPPAPPPPPRAPAVGDLLDAGRHSAIVLGAARRSDGTALVAVRFVRGPWAGTVTYRVRGCPDGGELVDLASGVRRAWERGDPGIFATVAAVACGEPPPAVGFSS